MESLQSRYNCAIILIYFLCKDIYKEVIILLLAIISIAPGIPKKKSGFLICYWNESYCSQESEYLKK